MTSCLRKIVTPGIQPMLPQQKGVGGWKSFEHLFQVTSEPPHVLVVFQNRQPLDVLVCRDAFEPLEHLVAGDGQAAFCHPVLGKKSAPDGVSVEDTAGVPRADDSEVQRSFCGGFAFSLEDN